MKRTNRNLMIMTMLLGGMLSYTSPAMAQARISAGSGPERMSGHRGAGSAATMSQQPSSSRMQPSASRQQAQSVRPQSQPERRSEQSAASRSTFDGGRRPGMTTTTRSAERRTGTMANGRRPMGNQPTESRPGGNNYRPGSNNGGFSDRPGGNGSNRPGSGNNNGGNSNGRRPGYNGNNGSGFSNRPGSNNYRPEANRPGSGYYSHNDRKYDHYRYDGKMRPRGGDDRFYWNYSHNDWRRPVMPPERRYRPASL